MKKKEEEETKICAMVETEAIKSEIESETIEAGVGTEREGKAERVGSTSVQPRETQVEKASRNRNRSKWETRYEQCKAFAKTMGHCKIPTNYGDNKSLGVWVQEQRRNYKLIKRGKEPRFKMTDEQMERLDDIGFHWGYTPDPNGAAESDASWDANFNALVEYHAVHGNFDVPLVKDKTMYHRLAVWTRVQRNQRYRRDSKLKCFINKNRIDKLTAIGFDWNGRRKLD